MLKISYIPDFKAGQPFLVITGDSAGLLKAALHFRHISSGVLNDKAITGMCDLDLLESGPLYLTEQECAEISQHFEQVATAGKPCHAYMDIEVLPNAELIISLGEYQF